MGSFVALEMDSDDEYSPRIVIDNDACDSATVIRVVHGVHKHGILLQAVQAFTDLNLIITKAYISSDGSWFMDVFNVTDRDGSKVWDREIISCIQTSLETDACFFPTLRNSVGVIKIHSLESEACFFPALRSSVGMMPSEEHTIIELMGNDRPGLFSEICAVLKDLHCNVVKAEVWTHNTRAAAVVHVTDESTTGAIEDPQRLSTIKELLCNVLKGHNASRSAKMVVSTGLTHTERRLHQMMFDDRDYDTVVATGEGDEKSRPQVAIMDCSEKGYTIVILRSKDRPKLLFDTICTLTDMQYAVFHGMVDTESAEAYQEYYVRHVDGSPMSSKAERQRVIQCLEAAIERRASEGLELELRTGDRVGLLSDITRIFREHGLCLRRADISTAGGKAVDTFCLSDLSGNPVEAKTIDSLRRQIGQTVLKVKQYPSPHKPPEAARTIGSLFGNFLKVCSFQSFRLIRSY